MMPASAMTCAWNDTSDTANGSSQRGAREKTARTAASSRLARSARPTASSITSTLPSGGKVTKLSTSLLSRNRTPSPVNRPLTATGCAVPGTVTVTWQAATTVVITASAANR